MAGKSMKVHAIEGKSIHTVYTHKDLEFWIGADFWPSGEEYNVIYKVGLNNSWFCTPYDPAGYGMGKSTLPMTDDVEQVIRDYVESIKEAAAENHMYAVWNMMCHRNEWNSNGNESAAKELDSFPPHSARMGTYRLIVIDGEKSSPQPIPNSFIGFTLYFCYLYEKDSAAEIWATSIANERGYIKTLEMAYPQGPNPENELFAYISSNADANYRMRGGELAAYIPDEESYREYLHREYSHQPICLYSK